MGPRRAVEASRLATSRDSEANPSVSRGRAEDSTAPKEPTDWFHKFFQVALMIAAIYGLYECNFVNVLLYSSQVNRPFVTFAVGLTSCVMALAVYLDLYRQRVLGEKISYNTAKSTTHALISLILLTGISLHIGLWPVWGWLTIFIMLMWYYGLMFNLILVFPGPMQQVFFITAFLWFTYKYIGVGGDYQL